MLLFRKAVLFIHGFSASYYENEYFINTLQEYPELDVYTFTLPGHETSFMRKVKYPSWIEKSEEMFLHLSKIYDVIYIVGHSMGGVIASYLASKYPNKVKRMVLIAPAFQYGSFKQNKQDVLDFVKRNGLEGTTGYDSFIQKILTVPATRILEFTKLVKAYRSCIDSVGCPTLILHGTIDNVVPFESSMYAFDHLSGKKHLTILEGLRHQVFISDKKEEITRYIYSFLKGDIRFSRVKKDII